MKGRAMRYYVHYELRGEGKHYRVDPKVIEVERPIENEEDIQDFLERPLQAEEDELDRALAEHGELRLFRKVKVLSFSPMA